jgi:DeoR/GlpR family transcriptional regulator of sugar metabolism
MLQDLHADHLFLVVDVLHPDVGFSTPDILEAELNNVMIPDWQDPVRSANHHR